ncbi:MAG: hypothetical protein R2786_02185 [Flavobacteriaceae bacterium]
MKTTIPMRRGISVFVFFFCIFMGNIVFMYSQDYQDICIVLDDQEADIVNYSGSEDLAFLSSLDPVVLNVFFWRIDDQYGNVHPWALTEEIALQGIQNLNIIFNPAGIFFKYRGWDSFNSPPDVVNEIYDYNLGHCINTIPEIDPDGYQMISRCQLGEFRTFVNDNGYKRNDALNIYVAAGTVDFGGAKLNDTMSLTTTGPLIATGNAHELMHNFGLDHTFQNWDNSGCEHVTRDPSLICDPFHPEIICFNADNKGDKVIDTAAMPDFRFEYCVLNGLPLSDCIGENSFRFYYYDQDNCEYFGHEEPYYRGDCQGTIYEINAIQSQNYMGYNPAGCSNYFTTGQAIKMREKIAATNSISATVTTIPSLYEPYKGSYTHIDDPTCTDPPLFQPGFEYRFMPCNCDCPYPTDYEDTSFDYVFGTTHTISKYESDFSTITHPKYTAIGIKNNFPEFWPQPRKCWSNEEITGISGTIIKFNDNVFNNNITITPQDSTQINNPNLIDGLDPGLYNIIKTQQNGSQVETVILKENNE